LQAKAHRLLTLLPFSTPDDREQKQENGMQANMKEGAMAGHVAPHGRLSKMPPALATAGAAISLPDAPGNSRRSPGDVVPKCGMTWSGQGAKP
jgi:hypothetical protein